MNLDTLGKKIGLGYALLVLLLTVSVGLTLVQVRQLTATAERLFTLSQPTAETGLTLQNGLASALASLRGYMLIPEQKYRLEREEAWANSIRPALGKLDELSSDWRSSEMRTQLSAIKPMIDQLYRHQDRIEELVLSDHDAATRMLNDKAAPLAAQITSLLGNMIDNQHQLYLSDADQIAGQISLLNTLEWILLGAGLISAVLLSLLVTRAITVPLTRAVGVAEHIAAGNLDTAIDIRGAREVETLGNALVDMRDALKTKTRETERHAWLSSGQNRLNDVMRGDKSIDELTTATITFLATYTGCHIGALYLIDPNQSELALAGCYAFAGRPRHDRFQLGQGLIGQAAADGQAILISDLEEQQLKVQSSLLDTNPRAVLVFPFQYNGRILGVLELGKFESFNEDQLEFIRANAEAVGIVMSSSLARTRIQQLLDETQRQSEELQQQQEELEQSNEELEEQAQQLREQQEELQASNEELEEQARLVAQKNDDLESARINIELKARELEISSKYKSEFLANMSHELRTPLNSLLILANDLARNEAGNLSDDQVESAQVISRSGYDLLNLINDILDLSKIEAGRMDLNLANIRIRDIAEDLRRTFGPQAKEKHLQLTLDIDELLPDTIHTDQQRLEQVLRNLVANALKFTEQGEVGITFRRDPGDNLSISVRDTGIGVPKDKQALIFEAFVQAEGGTSRKYGGTGLGLSICRDLAKLLGGAIRVDSELGKGSTFSLTLPMASTTQHSAAAQRQAQAQTTPSPTEAAKTDSERFLNCPSIPDQRSIISAEDHVVLIIEDDNEFAQILANQAIRKGFKHLNASTGEDGLHLAERYKPHAIMLDLNLPGIDGHMVLRELKNAPNLRHIPVHIISACEKTLDPIKAGAVDYLTKPVDKAQLDSAFARMEDFINRKMKNLLIIEDDVNLRRSIVRLIGNGDVKCCEAGTGAEALELLHQQPIDCIVLDIGLPDISGFDLIRGLERDKSIRVPPIIVYTGRELTRQESEELEQYAETVIVKGVKSEERLLDETALFLHRTLSKLPPHKRELITSLYEQSVQLSGKQILLVDDDMRNVFALSKVLGEQGMKVIKADNGRVALQALSDHPDIDFVLMDIMMPEMDGYECMQEIRKQGQFRDLPIVALTAKAMNDDRKKCIDAGASDYIAKPVDVERLLSLMRIWMRKQ